MSSTIKSRLSNSYLIGEIFGMLFFGVLIDRLGRRTGIVAATAFLVLGVVLATAAHGKSNLGYIQPPSINSSYSNEIQHVLDDDCRSWSRRFWCRRRISRLRNECDRGQRRDVQIEKESRFSGSRNDGFLGRLGMNFPRQKGGQEMLKHF
jgi:stage III sporulation protein SpoIIIAA